MENEKKRFSKRTAIYEAAEKVFIPKGYDTIDLAQDNSEITVSDVYGNHQYFEVVVANNQKVIFKFLSAFKVEQVPVEYTDDKFIEVESEV